jgi:hypothetical protein
MMRIRNIYIHVFSAVFFIVAAGCGDGLLNTAVSKDECGTDGDTESVHDSDCDSEITVSCDDGFIWSGQICTAVSSCSDIEELNPGLPDGKYLVFPFTHAGAPDSSCSYFSFNGHSYYYCSTALSWIDARDSCRMAGMELVNITSEDENIVVGFIAGSDIWTGANDRVAEGEWHWVYGQDDGTKFWTGLNGGGPVDHMYSNWESGSPEEGGDHSDCGGFISGSNRWNDRPCEDKLSYVCESSFTPPAPAAGCTHKIFKEHHYYFCKNPVVWNDATRMCAGVDMTFAKIDDDEDFIKDNIDKSAWVFSDDVNDVCAVINPVTGMDNNVDCLYDKFGFICEGPAAALPPLPAVNCRYSEDGESFYYTCINDLNWNSSKSRCEDVDMQLLRIDDKDEDRFVSMHIFDDTWMSANDMDVEGEWRFAGPGNDEGVQFWQGDSKGISVNGLYSNWNVNEPDNHGSIDDYPGEDCGLMGIADYLWGDCMCESVHDYMCEARVVSLKEVSCKFISNNASLE